MQGFICHLRTLLLAFPLLIILATACGNISENPAAVNIPSSTAEISRGLSPESTAMVTIETAALTNTLLTNTPTLLTQTHILTEDRATSTRKTTPPLSAHGPYLAYLTETSEDGRQLTFLNADSSGRSVISLPEGIDLGAVGQSLSPNGEWLAFHNGSAGKEKASSNYLPDYDFSGPLDLTLKLMHLPDGEVITVSRLLSADYPGNFDELALDLIENDPFYAGAEDVEGVKQAIVSLFMMGIKDLGWSPNSRYLAFAGQMDGLSSDLYVFDTVARKIRRLTDGLGQMTGWIDWSPNGKWIFHSSTNTPEGMQWAPGIYAASLDGGEVKDLGGTMSYGGWISPNTIVTSEAANGMGIYALETRNVETGAKNILWKDSFSDYAVADDGSVAVCGSRNAYEYPEPGLYVFHLNGQREYISPEFDECSDLAFRGAGSDYLILVGPGGVLGISKNGKSTVIRPEDGRSVVSPDHKWMLLACNKYDRLICALELYDEKDVFIRQLALAQMETILWRPDSLGVYFNTEDKLFYVSLTDSEPVLVEDHLLANEPSGMFENWDFKWIS